MLSNVRLLPEAQIDLEEAAQWYEEQRAGLGLQFIEEVGVCLTLIDATPGSFQEVIPNVRRALTKRFPYAVYYRPESHQILVVAILHCSRSPRAWKVRSGRPSDP